MEADVLNDEGEYGYRHQAGPSGDKDRLVFRSDKKFGVQDQTEVWD